MTRHPHRRGSVSVTVELDEVLDEITDEAIKAEFEARFPGVASAPADLLELIREALVRHRPAEALALVEARLFAGRKPKVHA